MKFISAQPDTDYFVWQVRVQLNNFKKFNIEKDAIVLFSYEMGSEINKNAIKLAQDSKATIIFYPDRRSLEHKRYIPTIRPHILKTFFDTLSHITDGHDVFYHDSDIIFASLPDFEMMSLTNKICVSDTISYVGANYIKSKGEGLLEEMCGVVGIDKNIVIQNENNSGGAQYLIPKSIEMNYEYWDKVERDSARLYELMVNTSKKYTPSHPIQAWTADMWAVLWNFWLNGNESLITKELDFSWPTYPVDDFNRFHILHNAGVTPDRKELFFKGDFTARSPFGLKHENVSDKFCSIKYVEEIIETGKLLKE